MIDRHWLLALVLSSSALVALRAHADDPPATHGGRDATERAALRLELDTVLGRGGVVTLGEPASDALPREAADVDCVSFVISADYPVFENLDLGVRTRAIASRPACGATRRTRCSSRATSAWCR